MGYLFAVIVKFTMIQASVKAASCGHKLWLGMTVMLVSTHFSAQKVTLGHIQM